MKNHLKFYYSNQSTMLHVIMQYFLHFILPVKLCYSQMYVVRRFFCVYFQYPSHQERIWTFIIGAFHIIIWSPVHFWILYIIIKLQTNHHSIKLVKLPSYVQTTANHKPWYKSDGPWATVFVFPWLSVWLGIRLRVPPSHRYVHSSLYISLVSYNMYVKVMYV